MTTPTLPLPEPDHRRGTDLFYKIETVSAIQDAAYEAGKRAGRPEYFSDGHLAGVRWIRGIIADDAYAATFQSVGQYRQALLRSTP